MWFLTDDGVFAGCFCLNLAGGDIVTENPVQICGNPNYSFSCKIFYVSHIFLANSLQ